MSKNHALAAWAVTAALLTPTIAAGQQSGTYAGTLSNGDPISVEVGNNAFGHLAVTGLLIVPNKPIPCDPPPTTLTSQIGVEGNFVITGDGAIVRLYSSFEILDASLSFVGDTVSGTVSLTHPAFTRYMGRPTTAVICKLAKHPFTATLVPDPQIVPASAP